MAPRRTPLLYGMGSTTNPTINRAQVVSVADNEKAHADGGNHSGTGKETIVTTHSTSPDGQETVHTLPDGEVLGRTGSGQVQNPFEQGILDELVGGSLSSQTLTDWGIEQGASNELYDNPALFFNLWEENSGNATPNLQSADAEVGQLLYNLMFGTGNFTGSQLDYQNAYLNNLTTTDGGMFTMADVMSLINGPDTTILDAALKGVDQNGDPMTPDRQARYLNGMLLGAISNSVPDFAIGAYQSILNEAAMEYQTALVTNQFNGNYREFLVSRGYIALLGGQ